MQAQFSELLVSTVKICTSSSANYPRPAVLCRRPRLRRPGHCLYYYQLPQAPQPLPFSRVLILLILISQDEKCLITKDLKCLLWGTVFFSSRLFKSLICSCAVWSFGKRPLQLAASVKNPHVMWEKLWKMSVYLIYNTKMGTNLFLVTLFGYNLKLKE